MGLTLVLLATLAIVLVGVLPSIREARRRNFKAVFGFDPAMAEKYGRRHKEGMPIVRNYLDMIKTSRDDASTALDQTSLDGLNKKSGDNLAKRDRQYRHAYWLARKYGYISDKPRITKPAPVLVPIPRSQES